MSRDEMQQFVERFKEAPKGAAREVWVHMTCGEFFVMARDSVSHKVTSSRALGDAEKAG